MNTTQKIAQAKLDAKFTKAKAKVVEAPTPLNEKAYQKAKKEMAAHRIATRGHTPHGKAGDVTVKPATLKVEGISKSPS